jgi:hypothetical protein
MPKTVTKTASVSKVQGIELPEELTFTYSFEELVKGDAIPADEQLDDEDIRRAVNAKRNATERSKEQTKTVKASGFELPSQKISEPEVQVKTMVRALVASGKYSQEQAETFARNTLGL